MKKQTTLYNMIFPIWMLIIFPPVAFIMLAGNYVIDSLVIVICYYLFSLANVQDSLLQFYKNNILKVWLFGFLADIIGALILLKLFIIFGDLGVSNVIISAIGYDPFEHPVAVLIIILAILISGILIFLFNYKIIFEEQIEDRKIRRKVAITIAIITLPWTFLLPTKWFY